MSSPSTGDRTPAGTPGGVTAFTNLGNAGFQVLRGDCCILFDPFFQPVRGIGLRKGQTNVILITHDHWDHFSPNAVAEAAQEHEATVVGPGSVVRALARSVPARLLAEMEPPAPGRTLARRIGPVAVTAVRTRHARVHVSYLVEMPGLRIFDDADNEHTDCIDRSMLGRLDALLLCPWQGSGWVEFVEAVRPRRWFLIHVSDEEIDACERGEFFDGLCDRVPPGLVVLRPGRTLTDEQQ